MPRADVTAVDKFESSEQPAPWPKPLTAEQAQALRAGEPALSPWVVVAAQVVVSVLVALVAWMVSGAAAAWAAWYGGFAVWLPAALFARGLMSQFSSRNAITAGLGFFVWEAAKLAMTVALLAAAPKLMVDLNWLALLVGLVVTLKVYWLVPRLRVKRRKSKNEF